MKNIMSANSKIAQENRAFLLQNKIQALNIMAAPGAGKTSVILSLMDRLKDKYKLAVIEGDIASSIDAEKIEKIGIPVVQINTGGGCHLDANMIKASLTAFKNTKDLDFLFIENVGNLVCPSVFDLGETMKVVISSVAEGHDKPFKYVSMFESADIVILNKMDLSPYIDFDKEEFYRGVRAVNMKTPIFEISCKTDEGIDKLIENLLGR